RCNDDPCAAPRLPPIPVLSLCPAISQAAHWQSAAPCESSVPRVLPRAGDQAPHRLKPCLPLRILHASSQAGGVLSQCQHAVSVRLPLAPGTLLAVRVG